MRETIGFIGLGRMGASMCANLLAADHWVAVHDRRPDAAQRARGAAVMSSVREVAARCDMLITMLPGPGAVEEAMLGPRGGLSALRPGAVWIDMGTGTPALARRVAPTAAAAGIQAIDAPVGGGVAAAEAGTLAVFAGGHPDALERCRPVLGVLADRERIFHVGSHGSGYATKLLINLVWFGQALITAEALLGAKHAGLDLDVFQRALAGSSAASEFASRDAARLLDGDYLTSFGLRGCVEELACVLAEADGLELDIAPAVERAYRRAFERYGDVDGELLPVKLLEEINGISLRR